MTELKAYDPDNIFAKMLRGEIPHIAVYEDANVLGFMDIFPQSKGHTLMISKQSKATCLFDMNEDALGILIKGTQKVATAINQALSPDGVRIIQFNGEAAGQSVFHLHFHIIPIWTDRPLQPHGGGGADTQALQEIANKIRAHLT